MTEQSSQLFKNLLFRPAPIPSKAICIGVRSVGHYRIDPGWKDIVFHKAFIQFFWSVSGTGFLRLDGRKYLLPSGSVGVYFPYEKHDVGAEGPGPWEYRWWTMDGPLSEEIVRSLGLGAQRVHRAGPAPVALFDKLTKDVGDISYGGEMRADVTAFQLLSSMAIAAHPKEAAPVVRRKPLRSFRELALECIQKLWTDPNFGVEQMADALEVHRSVLARRFKSEFGMEPSEYIMRWRMQNALHMLTSTSLPIHQVAKECGWSDPNYFSRCVRKVAGCTPRMTRQDVLGRRK